MSAISPSQPAEPIPASQPAPAPLHAIDFAGLIEQCMSGAIGLIGKLARTFLWLLFRPVVLADRFAEPDFAKSFCPPLAFLVVGILCGCAVMHDLWTLSAETITRLAESQTGWVAWMGQMLIDDLAGLSLSTVIVRTLPAAVVTVLIASCAGHCLAARERRTAFAAAICLVMGFKLFLRFGQGLIQLALVWFSKMGPDFLPSSWPFETILQVAMYAYFAVIGYIFFFAGTRFLAKVLRQCNQGWLGAWPTSFGVAGVLSSLLFLGTFVAPHIAQNAVEVQHLEDDLCLLKAVPLGPARLDFRDGDAMYLATSVLLRNETDRQVLVALPRQIALENVALPIECHYESERILDGTCLLDPHTARVVRATWRIESDHHPDIASQLSVPLVIQLGSVDDVMRDQIQSSTLQVALEPNLLAEIQSDPQIGTATAPDGTIFK